MQVILDDVNRLEPGLPASYDSFPQLTAGVPGCAHYKQHLTVLTLSFLPMQPSLMSADFPKI